MNASITIEQAFAASMAEHDLSPGEIIGDGTFHRFDGPQDKRGKKNGWYVLHIERDLAWGAFGCWKTGINESWCSKSEASMSDDERRAHRERMARVAADVKAERERKAADAQRIVTGQWEQAGGVQANHPYVTKKGIRPYGAKQMRDSVLVPLFDVDGAQHSMQYIRSKPDESGKDRSFKSGGRVKGCFCPIGNTPNDNDTILISEGWATGCSLHQATGYTVLAAMFADNLLAVARAARERYPAARIVICADDDRETKGNPGLTKATEAACAIGAGLAVPDFGANRPDGATDFNDLHRHAGLDAVRWQIETAASLTGAEALAFDEPGAEATPTTNVREFPWEGNRQAGQVLEAKPEAQESDEEAIERLASLKPMQYDRVRKAEAKRMGVQVATLDKAVAEARGDAGGADDEDEMFPESEPWPDPVDGSALLGEITGLIHRFIICSDTTAQAAALWITMTWLIDSVDVAPIAAITAPEKRCGKSQLLFLIGRLSNRPLTSSNISSASLFRAVEAWKPTLLIDEADAFMRENEELRGLLNCGHTRDSAYVIRTVGEDHTPKRFFVWGAKAIAGIGHLADTVMDRSIPLELRRKLPTEQVEKLRHAEPELLENLRAQLARWADDNADAVRAARPMIPEALHDRAADNWEPLLQIADTAGGPWPDLARIAAIVISGEASQSQGVGTELLADIQDVFETKSTSRISSADLLNALCEDGEKAWATWNRGKPMSLKQLANRLSEYGIKSKNIRSGYAVSKGYDRSQFEETFSRYLNNPDFSATPLQPNNDGAHSVAGDPLRSGSRTASATLQPPSNKACSGVADEKAKSSEERNSVAGEDEEDV